MKRLRVPMPLLRWVLLVLYSAAVAGCILLMLDENVETEGVLVLLGVMVIGQALLIGGVGTTELCRPIHRRRLLIPVFAAATMGMVLVAGLLIALWELFELDGTGNTMTIVCWTTIAVSWIVWGVLLYHHAKRRERYSVLARFCTFLIAGSLAELLVVVPSHIVVSRRPGCLVGIGTMLGIIAGVYVMLFAFGPGVIWLFMRDRYQSEERPPICMECHYDLRGTIAPGTCPECGAPIHAQ